MAAEVLDGKRIAKEIQAEIKERVDRFVEEGQAAPTLAAVLVGDDPASQVYVRNKERACQRAGIRSQLHRMPEHSTTEEVLDLVQQLNEDSDVNGILVQLPLPRGVNTQVVLDAVSPLTDVDAFHPHPIPHSNSDLQSHRKCNHHRCLPTMDPCDFQDEHRRLNPVLCHRSDHRHRCRKAMHRFPMQ